MTRVRGFCRTSTRQVCIFLKTGNPVVRQLGKERAPPKTVR
jgi:hypothetical protein